MILGASMTPVSACLSHKVEQNELAQAMTSRSNRKSELLAFLCGDLHKIISLSYLNANAMAQSFLF